MSSSLFDAPLSVLEIAHTGPESADRCKRRDPRLRTGAARAQAAAAAVQRRRYQLGWKNPSQTATTAGQ